MKNTWLMAAALALAACSGGETVDPPTEARTAVREELRELQLAVLDEIDQAVSASFVYPDFGGTNWEAEVAVVRFGIDGGLTQDDFEAAVSRLIDALPEGTASYLTRAERVEAEFQSGTLYEGIGAFVAFRTEPQPRVLLLSVINGSPAEQAGLRAHDAIYKVDGFPITVEEGLSVIEKVRGPAGTEVMLEVASPSEDPREVSVRRERVTAADTLKGDIIDPGVLYLLVPVAVDEAFVENVTGIMQVASDQEPPPLGMIIDLRIAGSGAGWPLTEMLTLLGNGDMGSFAARAGEQSVSVPGVDVANSQTIPLALLVGPDTSGAPEVLAGALQASGRAPLVGLPTGGNVLSFRQLTLSDGSLLNYADSSYITSDGRDLSIGGLEPDLLVDADWDEVTLSSDPVLGGAIDFLLRQGSRD